MARFLAPIAMKLLTRRNFDITRLILEQRVKAKKEETIDDKRLHTRFPLEKKSTIRSCKQRSRQV